MDLPEKIAGIEARQMREMFKNFIALETETDWKDGTFVAKVRRMTPDFIAEQLKVTLSEAQCIQAALIAEEWVEPEKFTPTRKGMGLSHHLDRPKLPRAEAQTLLDKVLDWADRTNAVAGTRVMVKTIHLYGSLLQGVDMVSDVDLFVEFTTMDLGMDVQPEDQEREDELCEELTAISDYLSLSSDLGRQMMNDVPMRQVFPRLD